MIKWTPKDVIERMSKVLMPSQNNVGLVQQLKMRAQELRQLPKGQRYPIRPLER